MIEYKVRALETGDTAEEGALRNDHLRLIDLQSKRSRRSK